MAKRVYIIHAWDESPTSCWYQWLKQQLEAQGIAVFVPEIEMPNPNAPEVEPWVKTLHDILPDPDEDTLLIGHSVGCQAIMRYLASLDDGLRIGQAAFVAPWTHLINLGDDSMEIARPWLGTMLDWQTIRGRCSKFVAFFSDDDEWVPLSEATVFKDRLDAEAKIMYQMAHFDTIAQFPELLNEVQSLLK
jgi:predicted alpha/beta hydrolase family esterase